MVFLLLGCVNGSFLESAPNFQPNDLPGADAHVEAGHDHDAAGDGDGQNEQDQRRIGVEFDDHELGVLGVIVALVDLVINYL